MIPRLLTRQYRCGQDGTALRRDPHGRLRDSHCLEPTGKIVIIRAAPRWRQVRVWPAHPHHRIRPRGRGQYEGRRGDYDGAPGASVCLVLVAGVGRGHIYIVHVGDHPNAVTEGWGERGALEEGQNSHHTLIY